jgi:hypothetical protein
MRTHTEKKVGLFGYNRPRTTIVDVGWAVLICVGVVVM